MDYKFAFKSFLSIIMVLLISLSISCSSGGGTSTVRTKGPLPDLNVSGSVLNMPMDTISTLDPQLSIYSNSFEIIGCFMDGLMQPGSDGSLQYAVCNDMTVSDDGLLYTFKLRKDCYWSNGEPVTAHDFVYGWQRAIDPATGSEYAFLLSDIAHIKNAVAIQAGLMNPDQLGVKALDDYTFQAELTVPVAYFSQLLYFSTFYPANKAFVEACGETYCTSPETILSNGAFIITSWEPDVSLTLVKNTAYYGASDVKLAGINYTYYDTKDKQLEAYQSGQMDYLLLSKTMIADYKNNPEFRTVDTGFLYYASFNLNDPLVGNKNLRKAITFCIDRDYIANTIIADGSKGSYVPVPSGYAFNSKGQDFSKEGVEYPQYCAYNPELAKQYFEKAKAELGRNNMIIDFLIVNSSSQKNLAESFKQQVESTLPGITIEIKTVDKSAERRKTMSRGEYQIGLTNWGPDYSDPMTYLSMWQLGNTQNVEKYFNPHYEALLARCSDGDLCTKLDERWNALKQAEEMILDDAIMMPMYQGCNSVLISSKVKNIDFYAIALPRVYKRTTKQ